MMHISSPFSAWSKVDSTRETVPQYHNAEDVTFPIELALSRTEVRKMGYGGTRENRDGRAKGAINMVEVICKRPQEPRHHSDPEFSPGRSDRNTPPTVREDNRMHPGASSPAEHGDFDALINTLVPCMKFHSPELKVETRPDASGHGLETSELDPRRCSATRQAATAGIPSSNSRRLGHRRHNLASSGYLSYQAGRPSWECWSDAIDLHALMNSACPTPGRPAVHHVLNNKPVSLAQNMERNWIKNQG
ncbi:hypothetical protein V8E54_006711 [Elaphomyces granulatus]